ncbi:MAG: thioredoxin fold domain-containing protein [Bacteroidota bacterium]
MSFLRFGLLAALLLLTMPAQAQDAGPSAPIATDPAGAPAGINWVTFSEASQTAPQEGDFILLAGYATWCGWCDKIDQDVYGDETVQAYMNEHFQSVRVNTESRAVLEFADATVMEAQLAADLGMRGTPTTVFMKADGSQHWVLPGYREAPEFMLALRYFAEGAYENESFGDFVTREQGEGG